MAWCVLGLGNPGPEYEGSPHNLGFMVVDQLAKDLKAGPFSRGGKSLRTAARVRGGEAILAKPQTFMNLSGEAALQLIREGKVTADTLLVVYDDLDLPFGDVRLRLGGGPGTHNGMISLVESLETDRFPRLRLGIQRDLAPGERVDYLLSPFRAGEMETVTDMVARAADAARTVMIEGAERAMNRINRPRRQPEGGES